MTGSTSQYLIQDPYHEYGRLFIDHLYRRHGLQAVCLYTDRRERAEHGWRLAGLADGSIAAAYSADLRHLDRLVDAVEERHRVVAVIPFNETSLAPAAMLASRLNLGWVPEAIIARFRDKFAFKEHIRRTAPTIRMNASRLVSTPEDVLRWQTHPDYARFILKPNQGYGNRHIGSFGRDTVATEIHEYFQRLRGAPIVMEEYVGGVEYFVNGQIDATGKIHVIGIFVYERTAANGRHNIDTETARVPHGTPLFACVSEYACRVLQASGLFRSPFHLELKLDAAGPCLIEVAARLAGHDSAILSGELHGPQVDVIAWAAQHYLDAGIHSAPVLDWDRYNAFAVRYVHGVARRRERIYHLEGIAEVESIEEFHRWVQKPVIGMRLTPTVDSMSMPWSLILMARTEARVDAAAIEVRLLLRWNSFKSIWRRLTAGAAIFPRLVVARLRLHLGTALPSFARRSR